MKRDIVHRASYVGIGMLIPDYAPMRVECKNVKHHKDQGKQQAEDQTKINQGWFAAFLLILDWRELYGKKKDWPSRAFLFRSDFSMAVPV
jgi:hypothetical protein